MTSVSICYLNGDYLPLTEARVSVLDRGFIFGDGIYEVIPVFGGRAFRFPEHLRRLARSLDAIGLEVSLGPDDWSGLVAALLARNALSDASVYMQITRGVAPRNHAAPESCEPTIFAMASPLVLPAEVMPVAAISLPDLRWQRCDIKAISLLPNVMARTAAVEAGAYEALLFRENLLTEGAASNVFVVKDGRIMTPPHSPFILPGITRDALVEALSGSADVVAEVQVPRSVVESADELWLSSSTRDIVPVTILDGKPVGDGKPGPVYRRALARYLEFKAASTR
jgi:D-alanine transaminase